MTEEVRKAIDDGFLASAGEFRRRPDIVSAASEMRTLVLAPPARCIIKQGKYAPGMLFVAGEGDGQRANSDRLIDDRRKLAWEAKAGRNSEVLPRVANPYAYCRYLRRA